MLSVTNYSTNFSFRTVCIEQDVEVRWFSRGLEGSLQGYRQAEYEYGQVIVFRTSGRRNMAES